MEPYTQHADLTEWTALTRELAVEGDGYEYALDKLIDLSLLDDDRMTIAYSPSFDTLRIYGDFDDQFELAVSAISGGRRTVVPVIHEQSDW